MTGSSGKDARMQDARCKMQDARCKMQGCKDARCKDARMQGYKDIMGKAGIKGKSVRR
jgi:hypothetical protein